MIKYVELTAPEASAFRQAKILSIECKEGDQIKEGDTLFRVQSGSHEINLPATKAGKIVELIASKNEGITLSTALLLLETEVDGSTASTPISCDEVDNIGVNEAAEEASNSVNLNASDIAPKADTSTNSVDPEEKKKTSPNQKSKRRAKKAETQVKQHTQQSLDLGDGDIFQEPEETRHQDNSNAIKQTSQAMSSNSITQITVPDIGADSAKVIDILVAVGDTVELEDPLVTLESDKASMDVPSTVAGVVTAISVSVDQDVSEGTALFEVEATANETNEESNKAAADDTPQVPAKQETASKVTTPEQPSSATASTPVAIPDIGGDSAKVIEILVSVGDEVALEDPLVTLESDKASMDVPSSVAGVVQSIEVNIDDDASEGTVVAIISGTSTSQAAPASKPSESTKSANTQTSNTAAPAANSKAKTEPLSDLGAPKTPQGKSHASPSIRRFARELGVDLSTVSGSGRKGRVTQDDVKKFVKNALANPAASPGATGTGIAPVPAQDFSKFGEIDIQPLNKIKRLTAENLHRAWLNVPHVTHHDESNISDLEDFRKQLNNEYKRSNQDTKLSPLAFIVKAVVNALRKYPQFNSSLEPGGENLIYKKYFNIGIAVETPNGLVVPVLKDADKKSVGEIAREMGELAAKARDKKLTMADMSGACITISSLGGIGGTSFTPIVNTPEVAILGVSRSKMQPVWNGDEFVPGMVLPLSLSYDHRVIDGAEAARFTRHIAAVLEDVRRLTV